MASCHVPGPMSKSYKKHEVSSLKNLFVIDMGFMKGFRDFHWANSCKLLFFNKCDVLGPLRIIIIIIIIYYITIITLIYNIYKEY